MFILYKLLQEGLKEQCQGKVTKLPPLSFSSGSVQTVIWGMQTAGTALVVSHILLLLCHIYYYLRLLLLLNEF